MKTVIRALEDQFDICHRGQVRKELASIEFDGFKEMRENEINYNAQLKEALQQAKDVNVTTKFDTVRAVRRGLIGSTMMKARCLIEVQLEKLKHELQQRQVYLVKQLQAHIDEYTRSRPLVMEFQYKEKLLDQLESQKSKLVNELKEFRKNSQNERVVTEIMIKESILEMAQQGLRYYNVVDKFKNPNKKMVKVAHAKLKAKKAKRQLQKPSSSVPEPSGIELNGEMMPETTATFKCQETIDTKKVADGKSFNRCSLSRTAIRGQKTEGNMGRQGEKPQTKSKTVDDRSFVAKNQTEKTEEKI